jgi:hypothetical protein
VSLERALKAEREYRDSKSFCLVLPEPDPVGEFLVAQGPEALPLYQRLFARYRRPQNARERQYLDVALRGLVAFDLSRSLPTLEALALDTTGDQSVANRLLDLVHSYASRTDAVRILGRRLLLERDLHIRGARVYFILYLGDPAALPWLEKALAQETKWVKSDPSRAKLLTELERSILLLHTPDTCRLKSTEHIPKGWGCTYFCPGSQPAFFMDSLLRPCPETSPLPYGPRPEHPKREPGTEGKEERRPSRKFHEWRKKLEQGTPVTPLDPTQ